MAGATFAANLVCPERALFEGRAKAVSCRTSDGLITMQNLHTPLVADVLPGVVTIETETGDLAVLVHGGFLQVATGPGLDPEVENAPGSTVTVLAGVAELVSEIDVARAELAKAAAEAELSGLSGSNAGEDDHVVASRRMSAEADLARADLRLATARQ
ncbi:MAG: F0F1 ATP synthase subunit epsilon [Actinomycetota bacterium]